jgi:hypothetical protein
LVNSSTTLDELKEEEKIYGLFRHEGSVAHAVNLSVAAVRELFANGWQLMDCGILD